ncbi:acetylserotonin O-methyltransferase [Kutzneria sp. CA-103260]|uniref:acetylserotonin O-methyltransferase n=1 Tax=Kutzneria sp. CA-103260 TaxID=2802641 RepID=UPI001BED720E|nr:acetylserotonin O-methyltransferase [Kutzneria sp. CA-103260]QUQ65454.1 O-demethylpuromycin-O-methyltransferase [Kutzneria sp. CA-103260]
MNDDAVRLLRLSEGFGPAQALQFAADLGVADLLGAGPRDAGELAAAVSAHPDALYRLLRALASVGVFTEVAPGRFGLTSIGDRLREGHPQSLRSWVRFQGLFNHVYADGLHSLRTGTPTAPQVFGEPLFAHLRQNAEHGSIFNAAMGEHCRVTGGALADSYDFTRAGQIVDVGGGDGSFLSIILGAYPNTTGVIHDLPCLADAAHRQMAASGLGKRCTFVGGDFFREVPSGGDTYMLKGVLHNWPDEQARTVLSNCRRAMDPRGRLLLIEWVMPTGDTPHPSKFLDLAMLFVYGGHERTEAEHVRLLTDAGLRLDRVIGSASMPNVIVAVPGDGASLGG